MKPLVLECNERELLAMGRLMLHALNNPGTAIRVTMVDQHTGQEATYAVAALRAGTEEANNGAN
jgi:hypothetical protein